MRKIINFLREILFIHKPTKIKKMANFQSNHDLNESVSLPDGKTGVITAVTFTTPTNPTYTVTIEVPAHTETESTQLDG